MIKIDVTHNLDKLAREIGALRESIPRAAAKALTATARAVERAEQKEMERVFDRPTPWALRGLFVKPASPLQLRAVVGLKDFAGKGTAAAKFLYAQIHGGNRSLKRFELALRHAGALPAGMFAVPGAAARLDPYGNISRGQIVQVLSQLRAQRSGGFESRLSADPARAARAIKRAGGRYFVGRPGNGSLPLGVWQKRGARVSPVLIFVRAPRYAPRFRFYEVAQGTVDRVFHSEYTKALNEEMRGA